MEPLSYTFKFVENVYIKKANPSGGIAKLRQDYYVNNAHSGTVIITKCK